MDFGNLVYLILRPVDGQWSEVYQSYHLLISGLVHLISDCTRLEDRASLVADLAAAAPSHVFNAIGVTGRPNVDWCESHRMETIRANVVGMLTLADVCRERGLIMINYATRFVFEFDEAHPLGSGIGFKEEEKKGLLEGIVEKQGREGQNVKENSKLRLEDERITLQNVNQNSKNAGTLRKSSIVLLSIDTRKEKWKNVVDDKVLREVRANPPALLPFE